VGDVWFGRYKPLKKLKFCRIQYLSWPNRVTVGLNSNRNRLPLGTVLYSDNRQQLITTMSTHERLQRDHATPEMNCWDDMRRFNVTRKGAARSLQAYIAVCPQTHCDPSSFSLFLVIAFLCSWCMVILHCSKFSYLHQPRFIVYFCGSFWCFWFCFLGTILCRVGCKTLTQLINWSKSHR